MNETEPNDQAAGEEGQPAVSYTAAYQDLLKQAIVALTAAARLRRPVLERTDDGQLIESLMGETEQSDWAEFVTLALAGAAANFGGLDAILEGRSGSWQAAGIRQLLTATVGEDEADLWAHRTEPLEITLYVDELLAESDSRAHAQYEAAVKEIDDGYSTALLTELKVDYEQYVWWYDRDDAGDFIGRSPEAPPWSWEAFRAQAHRAGVSQATVESVEQSLRDGVGLAADRPDETNAFIVKTSAAAEELWRLEDQYDAKLAVFGDLEERLYEQRLDEWSAYGQQLMDRVVAAAHATPGLKVPVRVAIDVKTFRNPTERAEDPHWNSLEARLVATAVLDTLTPADLPRTPMGRLLARAEKDG